MMAIFGLFVSLFLVYAPMANATNPVIFGEGFENSGIWSERSSDNFTLDNRVYRSGSQSVKVTATSKEQFMASPPIAVQPINGYRVRVWVKSNLAESAPSISLNVLQINADNQALSWYPNGQLKLISAGGGTQHWTLYEAALADLHPATVNVKLYLRLDEGNAGEVWFDDVALERINKVTYEEGFENSGIWSERNSNNFVLDNTVYRSGSQSVKVTATSEQQYMASPPIGVQPFDGYRVKVWVKSNLAESAPSISLNVLQINANNQALAWYPNGQLKLISAGGGTQHWTLYEAALTDMHPATVNVKLYLRLDGDNAGGVWFDDVSLERVNTILDGGFEAGLWNWGTGGFSRNTGEKHSGQYAASVTGQSKETYMFTERLPIQSTETYTLSLWIKTDQVSTSNGISVNVLQVDASNQASGWHEKFKLIATGGTTREWKKYEVKLSGFPETTAFLRVVLRADAGISGTAWFDDVRLTRMHRNGFIWGVSGHGEPAGDYPSSQLQEQIAKAAELGVGYYRVNVNPVYNKGNYDWRYMDQVINTAISKGLQVYLVMYSSLLGTAVDYERHATEIATRYKGKIAYYQLGNEVDNKCILSGHPDGSKTSHYDPLIYAELRDKILALGRGVRAGDKHAKRAINIAFKHTGFLDLLLQDNIPWEVNALDWYSHMGNVDGTLEKLQSYPQSEIVIAESNIFNGTQTHTEEEQAAYIAQITNHVYYNSPSKVKGFYMYELLDEPSLSGGEAHYGLVRYENKIIGPEKKAFGAYRDAIANKTSPGEPLQ